MTWAILSGIQGNLTNYEAVLADINRKFGRKFTSSAMWGPPQTAKKRIDFPHRNEIKPMICKVGGRTMFDFA